MDWIGKIVLAGIVGIVLIWIFVIAMLFNIDLIISAYVLGIFFIGVKIWGILQEGEWI